MTDNRHPEREVRCTKCHEPTTTRRPGQYDRVYCPTCRALVRREQRRKRYQKRERCKAEKRVVKSVPLTVSACDRCKLIVDCRYLVKHGKSPYCFAENPLNGLHFPKGTPGD